MQLTTRRPALLSCAAAALAATALVGAGSAAAAPPPAAGAPCPAAATTTPFTAWQDTADYVLAPDGGAEAGATAWTLQGGAGVVEGNEPFAIGGVADHRAIDLPAGSAATTAAMCIGVADRTLRFFLDGPATGRLSVQAVYTTAGGRETAMPLATAGGTGTWAVSDVIAMRVNELAPQAGGSLQVALRFTPRGPGSWRIDDVYVDPYRRK
jgi:hypothetical protein